MKLLYLNHNPENYGTYFRCYHLARNVAARGHKATLLCASRTQTLKTATRVEGGLTIKILPRVNLAQYHTGHTLRMLLNTWNCLIGDHDVLHSFAFPLHPISFPTLVSAKLRNKVKIVLDHDDMWKGGFTLHHPAPVRKLYDATEDALPRFAAQATAASDILMQKFRDAGLPDEKIHYIPNCPTVQPDAVDKAKCRAEIGLPADAKVLLSMGHTYYESLFLLLDAYDKAKTNLPGLKLVFLGKMHISNEYKRRMQPYLDKHGQDIVLVGEVPPTQVPVHLAASDALLLPMDDDPIEKARFPIRFGDYLASGVPIVSNAVGEIKRIMDTYDCGFTAPVDDGDAFAAQITRALTDKDARARIKRNAADLIETELNWETVAAKLEGVYEKALGEKIF